MPLQIRQRVERPFGAGDEPADGTVSEIAGGEIGKQPHGDVGGAGACGDHLLPVVLHVVRRQPVALLRHVLLEVAPGLPGDGVQKRLLPWLEVGRGGPHRKTDLPCHQGTDNPEQEQRSGRCQHPGMSGDEQPDADRKREHRTAGHDAHESPGVARGRAIGIGGSPPLEQVLVGPEHPPNRAHHGIDGHGRFVGEKDER